MLRKSPLPFSVFLSYIPVICTCAFVGNSFTLDTTMNNIRFGTWIMETSSQESVLQCSGKCEMRPDCLSFQFSSQTGHCSLFDTVFFFPSAGVQEPGWHYFTSSNRRCRQGFTDGRGRNFCFVFIGFQKANDGRTACSNLQSGIIDIQSDDDNTFLWKLSDTLKNETFPSNNYYTPYIQGQYDTVDLTWKLDTGIPLSYTNWDNQEPSNVNNKRKIRFVEKKWLTSYYYMIRPIICSYRL